MNDTFHTPTHNSLNDPDTDNAVSGMYSDAEYFADMQAETREQAGHQYHYRELATYYALMGDTDKADEMRRMAETMERSR